MPEEKDLKGVEKFESYGIISQLEKPLFKFFFLVRGLDVILFEKFILVQEKELPRLLDYLNSLYIRVIGRQTVAQSHQVAVTMDLKKVRNVARELVEHGVGEIIAVPKDESIQFRSLYRENFPGKFEPGFNPDYRIFLKQYLLAYASFDTQTVEYRDALMSYKAAFVPTKALGEVGEREGTPRDDPGEVLKTSVTHKIDGAVAVGLLGLETSACDSELINTSVTEPSVNETKVCENHCESGESVKRLAEPVVVDVRSECEDDCLAV